MGLLGQFIDVIEFVDTTDKLVVWKYVRPGNEIKEGAQLIVREGQTAVFLKGGVLADTFGPGTFTLSTGNLPILSTLQAFPYRFNSPIKADLYFVSTRQFFGNRWGTKNPIAKRDPEFGIVRLRAFGQYSFRVVEPVTMMREAFGGLNLRTTFDLIGYLDGMVAEATSQVIANSSMSVLDLGTSYRSLAQEITEMANQQAMRFGISFQSIVLENISLPDEVEKLLDEQTGLGMAKQDMATYVQYQTVRAMRDAANQEGGLAGLGAGAAFGNVIASQAAAVQQPVSASKADKLRELKALLDEGILTQEEFAEEKSKILLG